MRWTDPQRMMSTSPETYSRGGYVAAEVSTIGANVLVAPVAGKRIRVTRYYISASAAVNAWFISAGSNAIISGKKFMAASGGSAGAEAPNAGHFETAVGEGLSIWLSSGTECGVDLNYTIEDDNG